MVKIRVLDRESIQTVYARHHDHPGSVFYRCQGVAGPWRNVPMDTGKWGTNWKFAFLELESEYEAANYADSFASILVPAENKQRISKYTPIHKIEMPTRIYNCIMSTGIRTIGELFAYKHRSMRNWRQFGFISREELIKIMSKYELD